MNSTDSIPAASTIELDSSLCIKIVTLTTLGVVLLGVFRELLAVAMGIDSFEFGITSLRLDGEGNLLAWYSSALMILSASLMVISGLKARENDRQNALHWFLLGLAFVYLSIDESVAIHEHFGKLRYVLNLTGIFYHVWVVFAIPVLIIMGIIFTPFLLRVRRSTATRLVIAGTVYVAGAFGLELVSGIIYDGQMASWIKVLAFLAEETFEVVGLTLLIRALILHLVEDDAPKAVAFF